MIGDRIEVNMAGGLDIALPRMVHVRQKFQTKKLDSVTKTVVEQFKRPEVRAKVKPGMTIAVGCGSRGINNIAECAKAVVAELKALGMSGDEIRDVETDWRKAMGVIYWRAVGKALEPSFTATGPARNDTVNRWNALLRIDTWHTPSPAEMERFCANEQLLVTPDARERLDDYRHFLEHNHIRRRDRFVLQ